MTDKETKLIFEAYGAHKQRLGKIAYLRENFEDGASPFGNDSDDDKDDSDTDSDDSSSETSSDSSDSSSDDSSSESKSDSSSSSDSKSSSSSSSSSGSSSSSKAPKKDDGKLTDDELDEELDYLMAKKDKIKKLFDNESIDKDVAEQALEKIKVLTNQLVAKFI